MTRGQSKALENLARCHWEYPDRIRFASVHLGASTAALLRKIAADGYVSVSKGGKGSRQWFSITNKGLEHVYGEGRFGI